MIVRTSDEQARDTKRRRWARAIARGLALGGACALLGGWTGFVSGLVAAPLAWIEVWGEQRKRPLASALLAMVFAFVWLCSARLQGVYMASVSGLGGFDGAFEAVRLEALSLVTFAGPFPDGPMLWLGALVLALPPQLHRDWSVGLLLHAFAAGTLFMVGAFMVMLISVCMSWLPAALLLGLNTFVDHTVDLFIPDSWTGGTPGP